jgi:hypothetical protein
MRQIKLAQGSQAEPSRTEEAEPIWKLDRARDLLGRPNPIRAKKVAWVKNRSAIFGGGGTGLLASIDGSQE